jgi:hypothetical protein
MEEAMEPYLWMWILIAPLAFAVVSRISVGKAR